MDLEILKKKQANKQAKKKKPNKRTTTTKKTTQDVNKKMTLNELSEVLALFKMLSSWLTGRYYAFLRCTCSIRKNELWYIGVFNPLFNIQYNNQFQSCEMKQQIFLTLLSYSLGNVFISYKK